MKRTVLLMLIAVTAATACNRREDAGNTPGAVVSPPPAATTESPPSEPGPTEPEQAESTPVAPAGELPAQAEAPSATGEGCNAEPAQRLVGEVYTPELGEEARVTAGARVERALRPGQIVTMEFRADRLSFTLEEKGRISAVSCG
jgi:hypothetical protein